MLGSFSGAEILSVAITFAIPIALIAWLFSTFSRMARAQRDIADRLAGIERQLQSRPPA